MMKMRVVAALAGLSLVVGCGPELAGEEQRPESTQQGLTFEQFKAKAYQEPESGVWVYNGDETAESEAALRDVFDAYARDMVAAAANDGVGRKAQGLILNGAGRWSDTTKLNLTYCVSSASFGSRYSAAVNAMASAAAAWEGAARVNFIHLSQYDSSCTASQTGVLFDVRQVNSGGQYLARAFFPGQARSSRNVLIDTTAFSSTRPNLTGILRHELGHTIGFRHEHTRPESGACFEDNYWYVLTSYDPYSVMHYIQCNGRGDGYLNLTSLDRSGAASLYGAP